MERKSILFSLLYKSIERFSVKGAGLIIGIVLARLLLPEDFGQIAIITVFINLSNTIIQTGFNTALVQKKEVNESDYSTAFYVTAILSVVITGIICFTAPTIAGFYEDPGLINPIRVYSCSLFFGAFNSVQIAKIEREMRFKQLMIGSLMATVISGTLGIVMAYNNCGIWALVVYGIANTVFSCVAMLPIAQWFPRLLFSVKRAKEMFSFGWRMLVSSILCSLYNDLRSLVIGKCYSASELGYYNRGQQYPAVVSTTVESTIQAVFFPAMSRLQSNKDEVCKMVKRSISIGLFVIAPMLFGLAAVSENFVITILSPKWLPCVVYMQIICLAEIKFSFTTPCLVAIKSLGRSDIYMKLEVVRRVIMILILAITVLLFDSVFAVAISYLICSWGDVLIVSIPIKHLLGYSFVDQIKGNYKTLIVSLIMAFVVYFVGFLQINTVLLLCIQIVIGVCLYVLLCYLLKVESLDYFKSFFRKREEKS